MPFCGQEVVRFRKTLKADLPDLSNAFVDGNFKSRCSSFDVSFTIDVNFIDDINIGLIYFLVMKWYEDRRKFNTVKG